MKNDNLNNYTLAFLPALGIFLLVLLISNIATVPFLALQYLFHIPNSYFMAIAFAAGFGTAAIFVAMILKLNLNQLLSFFTWSRNVKYFALAVLIYLPAMPIAEYLSGIVPTDSPDFLAKWYQSVEKTFEDILKDPIPAFVSVSILAPLLEELIFRGLILRGLLNAKKNPYFSIIFVGILFGLAHGNPWQFLSAGFLGIILGFIYWRTKDLWICIFIHFLNNTISFVYTSIMGQELDQNIFKFNDFTLIFSLILVIAAMYLFYKETRKKYLKNI